MIAASGGDPRVLERALGLPDGFFDSKNLMRIDVANPREYELRIPSGNEAGANDQWIPGGELPDGSHEAIIDGGQVPLDGYDATEVTDRWTLMSISRRAALNIGGTHEI